MHDELEVSVVSGVHAAPLPARVGEDRRPEARPGLREVDPAQPLQVPPRRVRLRHAPAGVDALPRCVRGLNLRSQTQP